MMDVELLVNQAKSIVTPGSLTYGNAKRMLDLLHRYVLSGSLTEKQSTELQTLVDKADK